MKIHAPLLLLWILCLLAATAGPALCQELQEADLDPAYLEKKKRTGDEDLDARKALALWCRDQGYVREMIHELNQMLAVDEAHADARALLHRKPEGDSFVYHLPEAAFKKLPEPVVNMKKSERDRLLFKSKKKSLKSDKSFRFELITDLEKERSSVYAMVLNRYYSSLQGFFKITKTKLGIEVVLFAKRSDFLDFYDNCFDKSGEHVGGFYCYGKGYSFLSFFDNPFDEQKTLNTAQHECTHLLLKHCLQGVPVALWLNEGLACFFGGGEEDWTGSYPADCLYTVQRALEKEKGFTLLELMDVPDNKFKFEQYAFAWSWILYLRSNPETRDKMGKFMLKLKQEARDVEEGEDLCDATNRLFSRIVGDPEILQPGWDAFMDSLRPKTPNQKYYSTDLMLSKARWGGKEKPALAITEREDMLRQGETWLKEAFDEAEDELKGLYALQKITALLARAACLKYSMLEITHVATAGAGALDAFVADPENKALAAHAGDMARYILLAIWRKGDYKNPDEGRICDFPLLLEDKLEEARAELAEEGLKDYKIRLLDKKIRLLDYQQKVVEQLIDLGRFAFKTALAREPANLQAARGWLSLALEFKPSDLPEVFPHILLQANLDPDDRNVARLAAAYAIMGQEGFAKTLLKRAIRISPDTSDLSTYAYYAGYEEGEDWDEDE